MIARRLVALVLLLAPVQGSAAVFLRGDAHDRCRGHVCACFQKCATTPSAHHCHGGDEELGRRLRPGRCQHGDDGFVPLATRPHLMPAAAGTDVALATTLLAPACERFPLAGFRTIDLPPPRRLS
jgi:hypothetical protein